MNQAPFAIRGINVCESLSRHTPQQVERLLERMAAWEMNTLVVHPQYGYRRHEQAIRGFCRSHGITLVHYVYTTLAFMPEAPTELFAVDEQGRPHRHRVECETRLCASNPAAMQRFREGARRYLDVRAQAHDHLLLATPDGLLLCRCPRCRKLGAIEQWQPFLEVAVDEIRRSGKAITTHFIAYIGRFALPRDMSVFQHIDAVMFDTHPRYRWAALGEPHPLSPVEQIIAPHDARAADVPINQYLLDRLAEWRAAYSKSLYVFENLMIQASFSLPQPNTPLLLEDLRTFRKLNIDGVVYEAFEPGIGAFTDQLTTLSRCMAGRGEDYLPTRLDELSRNQPTDMTNRVLVYLFTPELADEKALAAHLPPRLAALGSLVRRSLRAPTWENWRTVTRYVLEHREELDWIYIAYRLATYLPAEQRPASLAPAARRIFATPKPWDYLEGESDPVAAAGELFEAMVQRSLD